MAEIIPIKCDSVQLPDSSSNKRFISKAEKLTKISNDLLSIRDELCDLDVAMLIEVPLLCSSSMSLYNALIESLELDARRILERVK